MVWCVFGLTWQVHVLKNAFKFVLQLLILSQKQILCVKNVVCGGFGLVGGGLGCFGEVVWGCFHGPFTNS